jgi:hypothetical protein
MMAPAADSVWRGAGSPQTSDVGVAAGAVRLRRLRLAGLLAGAALLTTSAMAALAAPSPSPTALGGWTAAGATLSTAAADAPGGRDATVLTTTGSAPIATLAGAANPTAGGTFAVRGYLRQLGGIGTRARVQVKDATGTVLSSAPVRLAGIWQTFGVTEPHAPAGAVTVTLSPAAGASWPTGTRVEVAVVLAGPTVPSVTKRVSGNNQITLSVNGGAAQVYNPRGYLYWPMIIGGQWPANSWADAATCQTDAQILAGAGVTMVQVPFDPDIFSNTTAVEQCADAFWGANVGVAWLTAGLGGTQTIVASPAYVPAYEQELQTAITDLAARPATQFWLIGNEEDLQSNGAACFFDAGTCNDGSAGGGGHYLRQIVDYMHANDPNHLVSTKICCSFPASTASPPVGCGPTAILSPSDVPKLDFWSVDNYQETSFGGLFTCLSQDDNTRPVLLSEFGNSRYDCIGKDSLYNVPGPGFNGNVNLACPQGSRESQDNQSFANKSLWQEILNNEATSARPTGELTGATTFMYSDLWWFSLTFFTESTGTPATHDVEATTFPNYPHHYWAPEWAGTAYAQNATQSGQPRITAAALTTLGQLWTGATYPTVSNVTVTPLITPTSLCQVQVTWTSATATTSRADWARDATTTMPNGNNQDPLMDNANFLDSVENSTMTTSHSLVLSGNLNPGLFVHVVVRGFDSSWRTAASQQIVVQIPLNACI